MPIRGFHGFPADRFSRVQPDQRIGDRTADRDLRIGKDFHQRIRRLGVGVDRAERFRRCRAHCRGLVRQQGYQNFHPFRIRQSILRHDDPRGGQPHRRMSVLRRDRESLYRFGIRRQTARGPHPDCRGRIFQRLLHYGRPVRSGQLGGKLGRKCPQQDVFLRGIVIQLDDFRFVDRNPAVSRSNHPGR